MDNALQLTTPPLRYTTGIVNPMNGGEITSRMGAMSRDDATRRVMKAIALKNPQVQLPYTAEDGTHPLVVALPSELISDVVGRVVSVGGHSNIAIAFATNFYLIVIDSDGRKKTDGEMEVTQDISMGMFLLKLQGHPNQSVRLRFKNIEAEAPSTQQELEYA